MCREENPVNDEEWSFVNNTLKGIEVVLSEPLTESKAATVQARFAKMCEIKDPTPEDLEVMRKDYSDIISVSVYAMLKNTGESNGTI